MSRAESSAKLTAVSSRGVVTRREAATVSREADITTVVATVSREADMVSREADITTVVATVSREVATDSVADMVHSVVSTLPTMTLRLSTP